MAPLLDSEFLTSMLRIRPHVAKLAALIAIVTLGLAAQTSLPKPHWRETSSETIWSGRFSDCDYGYSVWLPSSVVGHSTKPSAPGHGFLVNPAAPASDAAFSASDSQRFIEVVSYYDLEDHGESTLETIDYYLSLGALSGDKNFATLSVASFKLTGLNARREQVRWIENSIAIRRDRIIAYRRDGGVLYQLTLQSPEKRFAGDELLFNRIVAGFHLAKLPNGECSNN